MCIYLSHICQYQKISVESEIQQLQFSFLAVDGKKSNGLNRFFSFMQAERLSSYEWANGFKALEIDPILLSSALTRLV